MTPKRLRLDRIKARSLRSSKEQQRSDDHKRENTLSVREEALITMQKHHAQQAAYSNSHRAGALLTELFNVKLVDFVRLEGHSYVPVEWEAEATHRLLPTMWNEKPTRAMPNSSHALSVCAIPLKPKIRATSIAIKKVIPKAAPAYKTSSSVAGKRGVLSFLVQATKARVNKAALIRMSSEECDLLYHAIVRASKIKILHRALN